MVRTTKELMAERLNTKETFKNWKHVLDVIQNAIIICSSDKIIFINTVMTSLIDKSEIRTGNIVDDVSHCKI